MKSGHQSEFHRLIDYLASSCYTGVMDWERNIIAGAEQIRDLILRTKRIAVLGIKTEAQADQPAFYVPDYLVRAGFEIIPVPVYYPQVIEILGKHVYRRLIDIPDEIDLVDVFRRSHDINGHVEDLLAKKPKRCGSSRAFATIKWQSNWLKQESKSSKTVA